MRLFDRWRPRLAWPIIVPVVAGAVLATALGLLVCFLLAVIGGHPGAVAFGVPTGILLPLSLVTLLGARRLRSVPFRARDGFFAVTAAWLAASIVGAVPFLVDGTLASPADAFFESMSGFTTTGATMLDRIEAAPDPILLWRSLMQWIGGVGIVVLVVAVAPATGLAMARVFYAETSGVGAERLTPRLADTAKILWAIYLVFTATCFAAYMFAGMGPFDAINHSFTTIATGGFSTETASLAAFDSLAVELVAIVFMALGGVNFAFYWRAIRGRGIWPQAAEVRLYLLILLASIGAVTLSLELAEHAGGLWRSLRDAAFTVTSLMTSSGYVTVDYDQWNEFARGYLLVLTFIGGCAGSTAGGIKVIRVLLLAQTAGQEVQRQLRPKAVMVLRTRGRVYSEEIRRRVLGFFYIYLAVTVAVALVMVASGLDIVSGLSAAASTLNLTGPGLGAIGATENYSAVPESSRLFLSFVMLTGRLEVFTVLVLLTPAFWRPSVA